MARRSMTNALELTPEKREFIAKDVRDEPRQVKPAPEKQPEKTIELTDPEPTATERAAPNTVQHSSPSREQVQSRESAPAYGGGLVQLSVRLKPDLVRSIRRVLFEAKLNGHETLTQQDIVEEALKEWLAARS